MKKIPFLFILLIVSFAACIFFLPRPIPSPTPTPIQATATATARDVCIVEVTEALNLRSGAGITYAVKGWLSNGDILTKTGNYRASWIEVVTPSGARGWINNAFCKGVSK